MTMEVGSKEPRLGAVASIGDLSAMAPRGSGLAGWAGVAAGTVLALIVAACGDDGSDAPSGVGGTANSGGNPASSGGDTTNSGGTETGGADSGGAPTGGAPGSTGGDAASTGGAGSVGASLLLNGCDSEAAYEDLTAADATRYIDWSEPSQSCFKIRVGQSVIWSSDFNEHPLEAYGGDQPSPIRFVGMGVGEREVTFDTAGVYGFHCYVHLEGMRGTIWVVP